ncbi:MAG: polyphenol oxidase family protein [Planctomycetota bacterium]
MRFDDIQGRRYARFETLAGQSGLRHAFCLRPQDVSPRYDQHQAERARRRGQMAADLTLDVERLCYCIQVHEARIAVLEGPVVGGPLEGFDAVTTNAAGVPLMTFSADCPLVLLYDPRHAALGLAHASWHCTVAGLVGTLLKTMQKRWGSQPEHIWAGIGPGAGPCCYEVQQDVYEAASVLPDADKLFERRADRLYFDLWQANRAQLCAAGIPEARVELAGVCTLCRNDLFYSFRREGAGCGHFGLMAALI